MRETGREFEQPQPKSTGDARRPFLLCAANSIKRVLVQAK